MHFFVFKTINHSCISVESVKLLSCNDCSIMAYQGFLNYGTIPD